MLRLLLKVLRAMQSTPSNLVFDMNASARGHGSTEEDNP